MKITLEVVGPYAGTNFEFRNYSFHDGRCTIEGTPEQVGGAMKYLESTCQAYPVGSPELDAAKERIHGHISVQPTAGNRTPAEVLDSGETISRRSDSQDSDGREKPAASTPGDTGIQSPRTGPERTPDPAVEDPAKRKDRLERNRVEAEKKSISARTPKNG